MAEKAEGGVPAGAGGAPAPDEFRRFLVGLATDPAQLGRFIKDPLGTMAEAGLSPQDQATLQSADPGAIHARLTGAPTPGTPVTVLVVNVGEGAPGAETLHVTPAAQIVAPQIIHPQILPQQVIHPQIWPQQIIHPQVLPQTGQQQ